MRNTVALAFLGVIAQAAGAQQFDFPAAAVGDSSALSAYMPRLAAEVLRAYRDSDAVVDITNRFRLEAVAGKYGASRATLTTLEREQRLRVAPEVHATNLLYAIHASALEQPGASLEETLKTEFSRVLRALDDRTSALMIRALAFDPHALERGVGGALRGQRGRATISFSDALRLVRAYHTREVFRALSRVAAPIIAEDDRRRYLMASNVQVRTPDGATVCTFVVRPRGASRLPTLLNFTIYADTFSKLIDLRRIASNGYAAVVGYTRGKLCGPDTPVPYEYDGSDGAALVDWISQQPWSDGRVGMYSGSYEGFTQWAIAKHMPKALETIAPAVPVAPGLDVPMEGNVFVNFIYQWPFFTTNTRELDSATYNDFRRWNRMNREWYVSGRAYRDLEKIDGTPNPIFGRWIAHPTYDAYWQRMIPYRAEFARITIPVMATAGYYFGGPGAALYYFTEHHKYLPGAEHYLVIGPYDHPQGQRGVVNALGDTVSNLAGAGLEIDPVARVDFWPLRFQWFDYIFKGAPKPAILADKLNYQVVGANSWKHAPSVARMSNGTKRVPLGPATLSVDLANRSDIDRNIPGGGIVADTIDTVDAMKFVSEPLRAPTEVSGLFSGQLDFITNKKDFDLFVSLSELTPKGEYVLLSTMNLRASHAQSVVERKLLTPGKRERLRFSSIRLISRQLQPGSRLVVILGPIKAPVLQINYGSGKDVSDETIADAGDPMRIQLFATSYVDVPIFRSSDSARRQVSASPRSRRTTSESRLSRKARSTH